jgi:hypothetical protein
MSASVRCFGVSAARSELAEVLQALERLFSSVGVRWYLFGAQAVVAYGVPRLTADIDVTVDLAIDRVPDLVGQARSRDLTPRIEDLDPFVQRTRVIPLQHEPTGLPVDIVVAGPGLEVEFLGRAREVIIEGVSIPVISPEDLIVTKVLAGRPKDLEDVNGILRTGESLDLPRVREVLGLLEEALDRRDLLPGFETAIDESR